MAGYNVIWITCDAMQAGATSVYGNRLVHMPAAERMASEGVTFERAYVQMPKCIPSRCSMMTGRYPHCEGHRGLTAHPGPEGALTLDGSVPNLITILKERGYRTAIAGKNHLVDWDLFEQWFDRRPNWDARKRMKPPACDEQVSDRLWRAKYRGHVSDDWSLDTDPIAFDVRETVDFVRRNAGRPFVALCNTETPHPPYRFFPGYAKELDPDDVPIPPYRPLDRAPSLERIYRQVYELEDMTDRERRLIRAAYFNMCVFSDSLVNMILEELDRQAIADRTIVIYSADHGDFACEHNCTEKFDTFFYESQVRVPLIVRLPGVLPAGRRVPDVVELVDVMPTVLVMLDVDLPYSVQGVSLLALATGMADRHKGFAVSQGGVERQALARISTRLMGDPSQMYYLKNRVMVDHPESMMRARMIRTDRWKYIYRLAGDCELYDMEEDPDELDNLASDPGRGHVVDEMKDRLLRFMLAAETNLPEITELSV